MPDGERGLRGRVVLVTGAASGIGRAQVLRFLEEGARVVATDRDAGGLATLPGAGDGCLTVAADVTWREDVARLVGTAVESHGRIDVLSNTAGILDGFARSLDTSEELWERVFAVNVTAVFRLTNAVLPGMLAQGRGTVVNVASVASFVAGGGGAAYTASKHALLGYTRQLASDYGRRGIKVNAVCPGLVETGMTRERLAEPESRFMKAATAVPSGRYGQPDEIAAVAVFLAKPDSDFMQGAAVMVDGGLTIR
ncbi:SDR family NAD(P)-dependent oxidoreductase [Methylobacterium frigidaeris]|uniref:SDR family NAD(P)-dependent oxidoreductase n=1 Tax=Methylobacterium frigidaeris TaxID=2038277 RepID=UPI001EDF2034|nr:glucose 1-dehydrogenase [Methylobacterium frigidaeris]